MTKSEYKAWRAEIEISNLQNLVRLAQIFRVQPLPLHGAKSEERRRRSSRDKRKLKYLRRCIVNRMAELELVQKVQDNVSRFHDLWGNYSSGKVSQKWFTDNVITIPRAGTMRGVRATSVEVTDRHLYVHR